VTFMALGGGDGLAQDVSLHPGAMMEMNKLLGFLPHPGRDKSRGYAPP
jgi:hypothetical protein